MASDDGPVAWIRSLSDASRIFPLRPYPNPTSVGRHEDCDVQFMPQSISRHHATIQLSQTATTNSNAVAILRDSSFNGCFVGDDLVRNRAEWLGAGDVLRFGNDKEKESRQKAQTSVENYPLSPIEESNQHGGMIAGARSEHGQRFRGIGSMPEQQQQQQQQSPTRREQQQLPTSRVNNSTTPWASMDPPPKPHAPSSTSGGQTWQISFPTASGNQVRTSNENFIPPQPAPTQYDPNSPSRYQTNNSMFLEEPLRNSSENVDTKARNIYGGTMGGGVSSPTKNLLSNSMPNGPSAWGNQGQVNPGNYTLPPQPSSPPVAWGDLPLPSRPDPSQQQHAPQHPLQPVLQQPPQLQQQIPLSNPQSQRENVNCSDSLEDDGGIMKPPPPLPSGDELGIGSIALTASEKQSILSEKKSTAKHMRDLNMLLAGSLDPRDVEFVFTEPEEVEFEEDEGMGRRQASTGSLHSRLGKERRERERENLEGKAKLKYESDRALVARALGILEKHKTRGLQKAINKWKIEVRSMNMGRKEKEKMKELESKQKEKDKELEAKMLKETNENKQRSAIQLMIDSKKKGKQIMLLAGWNTWKHFIIEEKKSQFTRALRSKDNAHGVQRIAKMISSGKTRKIMKAWNRWKNEVINQIRSGDKENSKYTEVLKNRSNVLAKKVAEQDRQIRELEEELEGLKVNDWAQALANQQKIMSSLRRQLGRSERGWAAEAAAFAAACVNVVAYNPQASISGSDSKAGGSGLAGVLHQRKLKQQAKIAGGSSLKEKSLPSSVRNNPKVKQVQAYIVAKARELASIRREAEEYKRRADASGRNWSTLASERDELQRSLEEYKDSSVRQSAQLLDMVRERDARIMKLQKNLVALASMKGEKGGLSNGNNGELVGVLKKGDSGDQPPSQPKTVKIVNKRQQAAQFLANEFSDMQKEHTKRTQNLVNQLIELREMKKQGGSIVASGSMQHMSQGDLVHKCSAYASKVRRLEDELHETEVQGSVRALVEAQELIEALQSELATTDRKNRVLSSEISKRSTGMGGGLMANQLMLKGGNNGGLSARSGASTPSLLPSARDGADEAWEQHLESTANRLEEAREGYENELSGSGLLLKKSDEEDVMSDYDEEEEEEE
ncbi:hypothetical protein TL16_g02489 [Triparma laevis f. inornata]|uniref:FHA domain-containing protein n=1 Tax=Triparma laevis f. inornata TaxID=1714386 RepID=A0A9W7DXM8_9STRA|nr:hypothetical protein TL16_g02489 [Triparma laevis f. inornata]